MCPSCLAVPQSEDGAKRQKLSEVSPAVATSSSSSSSSSSSAAAVGKSGIRRSMRHRKLRGEKALIVSANQTLKELKIQVCAANSGVFCVSSRQICICVLIVVFIFLFCFWFLDAQIMHAFSVAPFDQNLSIDGRSLTDDLATLGSLGVFPESIICLKVVLYPSFLYFFVHSQNWWYILLLPDPVLCFRLMSQLQITRLWMMRTKVNTPNISKYTNAEHRLLFHALLIN